jgi:hypothetical protein
VGNSPAEGTAIAVDPQGNAYVGGYVWTDYGLPISFPVTVGTFQTAPPAIPPYGTIGAGFLAKLNVGASALVYSTYLGASNDTEVAALALNADTSVVALCQTWALDFPTTRGALFRDSPTGLLMNAVFKLAADGSRPLYSTYLVSGLPPAIALDSSGELYFAGNSLDPLPVVAGSFCSTGSGPFVAALALEPVPPKIRHPRAGRSLSAHPDW